MSGLQRAAIASWRATNLATHWSTVTTVCPDIKVFNSANGHNVPTNL